MKPVLAAWLSIGALTLPEASSACGVISNMASALPLVAPRKLFANPELRVNFGGAFAASLGGEARSAVDLYGGAFVGWPTPTIDGRSAWLLPEIGYSRRQLPEGLSTDLGSLGVGAGYGDFGKAIVLYTPRFVAGRSGFETSFGFRQTLTGHVFMTVLSLELSHQVLSTAGLLRHEVMISVGLNPLGFTPIVRWLAS